MKGLNNMEFKFGVGDIVRIKPVTKEVRNAV